MPERARQERDVIVRLAAATELVQAGSKQMPANFDVDVECAVVLPGVVHAGALLEGRFGRGFAVCQTDDGGISAPVPVKLRGGLDGISLGVESADVLLLFTDDRAKTALSKGGIALGEVASADIGNQGATSHALPRHGRISARSYSRSHGLFIGIEFGASVEADAFATTALYGSPQNIARILSGEIKTPARAQRFVQALATRLGRPAPAVAPSASL